MIGSLWRYSHFLLAIVSALFLIVASITGAILAVEPLSKFTEDYTISNLDTISLSDTIKILMNNYDEVLDIEITPEDFVKASIVYRNGDSKTIFINPINGYSLGNVKIQSPFFSFITNLHRSLFLKSIGRAFVGFVSFLLCFITVTGVFLLAQRQGGLKRWFTKVKEENDSQRYHVILGRWFLIPILIIATTGIHLSAEKFSLLPNDSVEHNWNAMASHGLNERAVSEFLVFQNLTLDKVRKITFPFSEDAEDYFELALNDKELLVHQYTGEIVSEKEYPFIKMTSLLSMQLHTGQGSVFWSIILFLASLSLLFFMFSGFAMRIKRSKKIKTIFSNWTKDKAEYILLVGSESGNTFVYANAFAAALEKNNKKVHIATLNEYRVYDNATHLIVFTSTYGDGDAPTNARNFQNVFNIIKPIKNLQFSVIGFGSLDYPKYCHFAIKVNDLLHGHPNYLSLLPLVKINEQSLVEFTDWIKKWNEHTGMRLSVTLPNQKKKMKKNQSFVVIERTPLNIDNTALLRLRPKKKSGFQSGDLLSIVPPEDTFARQYSIARIDDDILLSIKWHPKGICSTYLCTLKKDSIISGSIEKNMKFHFPKKAYSVWMIANGTGIAPYLGMLNDTKTTVQLTWGGRVEASFDCYRDVLDRSFFQKQTKDYQLVFSQVKDKAYVQDILLNRKAEVAKTLKEGGVFMLCGSIAMQNDVLDVLDRIVTTQLQQPLSDFENNQQILMDCY